MLGSIPTCAMTVLKSEPVPFQLDWKSCIGMSYKKIFSQSQEQFPLVELLLKLLFSQLVHCLIYLVLSTFHPSWKKIRGCHGF